MAKNRQPSLHEETGVNLTNSMLLWTADKKVFASNPVRGLMVLVDWPPKSRTPAQYVSSWGACNAEVREAQAEQRRLMLAATLLSIMARDGIAPQEMHRACWPLEEYRSMLANDVRAPEEVG